MGETDVSFRYLLRGLPQPILQLAFPDRRIEPLGPFDPSVDRPRQRTSDNLFRVRDGKRRAGVHVEIEREWRRTLPRRLFEYASAAVTSTRLPVWSIAVLLRPGGRPPQGTGVYRIPGPSGDAFVFRYQVVPLWQLDAREMRGRIGTRGAPFCVAMQGASEAFVHDLVEDVRHDRALRDRERRTTMQLLYVMSAAILGSDTARRIFPMESLFQDPNVQELINEWKDRGRAEGREEGRAEGRAKGRAEGRAEGRAKGRAEGRAAGRIEGRALEARTLLYKVLAARKLTVTERARARIDHEREVARLEAWLENAITAGTLRDVFRAS